MGKITLSVIKADIGSLAGHHIVPEALIKKAGEELESAKQQGLIKDYYVTSVGDDLQLIITHGRGELDSEIHRLAWETFREATELARKLKLYGAGQDLLVDSFSGNLKGMGPGFAELEFEERPSEPVVVFMADKTSPGAFNLPIYRIFADPFNTAGLVIDPKMHTGFQFEVMDVKEDKSVIMSAPEELYDLLALIGDISRYVIRRVWRKDGLIAAAVSTTKLSKIAGKYVGKDDPVAIVRAQHGLPALGEILEAFSHPHLVPGWMRGSHYGPLMPVSIRDAKPTRFDGLPRISALGFNIADGRLIGPSDLFDDVAFDLARNTASLIADYLRRHGPFMPHRIESQEMEYTTLPQILEKLKERFKGE